MSNIHTLERHTFPVLSEQFLVDKTYDFIKELGQGQFMSYLPAHRVGGSLEGGQRTRGDGAPNGPVHAADDGWGSLGQVRME